MDTITEHLILHPFSAAEAARVVHNRPSEEDHWAADYPLADELGPLRGFVSTAEQSADRGPFGLYMIRDRAGGEAIGGIGFAGPPGADGAVEVGYG